jgi:hypothetical protein
MNVHVCVCEMKGPFDSAEALLAALDSGRAITCSAPEWGSPGYDYQWATTYPQQVETQLHFTCLASE